MTLGSLFDGIAGFPLAAYRHGINTIWASEIEKDCIDIATKHFPHVKQLGDITQIDGAKIDPVDIVSFGSPCQDLSVAGKQEGLSGERSGLFLEAIRIVREMRCKTNGKYPKFVIWENVAGAFSSNKGNDFRRVLEEITESNISIPSSGRWATAGMVGNERNGLKTSTAWRQLDAQFWGVPQRRKRIYLVHDFTGERAGEILFKCESLLGYHTEGRKQTEGDTGNIENFIAGTDCRRMGEEPGGQLKIDFLSSDGGCSATGIYPLPVPVIAGNIIGRNDKNGGHQLGISQDIAPTLTVNDRHAIAAPDAIPYTQSGYSQFKEGIGTLKKSRGPAGEGSETIIVQKMEQFISKIKYRARRLTPLECERLDGFPDNWTGYGASGKEMSDNARYMALGNSIAVPCAERVFIGILQIEKEG